MSSAANVYLPIETSVIRDADNQNYQLKVNSDGSVNTTSSQAAAKVTVTGTISSAYVSGLAQVNTAVSEGHNTFSAFIAPSNFTGSLFWVWSIDGATWYPLFTQRTDAFGSAPYSTVAFSASSATQDVVGTIPKNAAYIGVICSPYSSGSVTITLSASSGIAAQIVSTQTQLLDGVARVGFTATAGITFVESITPVSANQTITGPARLTFNTSINTAWSSSSGYGSSFRAIAGADVVGTIYVEFSNNSIDWYPVTGGSVTLAQFGGSGLFGGYVEVPVVGLYMRAKLTNGNSGQAKAYLSSILVG